MGLDLLTTQNAKTIKGEELGWLTGILYLGHTQNGVYSLFRTRLLCPFSTEDCRDACLVHAGRGMMSSVIDAREDKADLVLHGPRTDLYHKLDRDIKELHKLASKRGLRACVRLNGTSDLMWARIFPTLFTKWSFIQFYDYTKYHFWIYTGEVYPRPPNYHLTYSMRFNNKVADEPGDIGLPDDINMAVVFDTPKGQPLPETYKGRRVIDGDLHDLRFLDPPGVVVGLRVKGHHAKKAVEGSTFIQAVANL